MILLVNLICKPRKKETFPWCQLSPTEKACCPSIDTWEGTMWTGEKLRPRESVSESMKTRTSKHSSTERPEVFTVTPAPPKALFPPLLATSSRDAGLQHLRDSHPQHTVSSSALLFFSSWLLRKICLFFYFLCQYVRPAAKTNTQQCGNTPIPEPEKRKRKKMKTSLHTCGTGTQELDFWKKRKQLCIPVFLPSSPIPIFHPHPTPRKPEGLSSLGVLPEGQGHQQLQTHSLPGPAPPFRFVPVGLGGVIQGQPHQSVCVPVLEVLLFGSRSLAHLQWSH